MSETEAPYYVVTGKDDVLLYIAPTFEECFEYACSHPLPYYQRIYKRVQTNERWEYVFLVTITA